MADTKALIIKAKGGLGNRILSAATGIALAEAVGRTPVIDWRDGGYAAPGVNAYPLLFEASDQIDPAAFDARTDVTPELWAGRLGVHPVDVVEELFPTRHSSPFVYRRLSLPLSRPRVGSELAVFWSYLPKMARLRRVLADDPRSLKEITRDVLDRWFRPNARVRSAVEELFAGRTRPVIGVHIRYTDRKVSLDRVHAAVHRVRGEVPDAQIFLATDNKQVQADFRAVFEDVFVIEKELGDDEHSLHEAVAVADPVREAENALIDMWALARCDWLVHSRVSTFSVTASLVGGIPLSRQVDIDRLNPRVVGKRWVQTWA